MAELLKSTTGEIISKQNNEVRRQNIKLPKQLDLNGNITITVTGELEKSHIVAQS